MTDDLLYTVDCGVGTILIDFVRVYKTLRVPPEMAARVTDRL